MLLHNALFPRSEAKGKYVLFRSQQRRLRLVLLQQRGNSSVICRAFSRQLHIWIDQQRGNMLCFLSARGDFAVSDCNRKMVRSGELGRGWDLHDRLEQIPINELIVVVTLKSFQI